MMTDTPCVKKGNWLDTMADLMAKKMAYEKLEHDMIILHHIFGVEYPDGKLVSFHSVFSSFH